MGREDRDGCKILSSYLCSLFGDVQNDLIAA